MDSPWIFVWWANSITWKIKIYCENSAKAISSIAIKVAKWRRVKWLWPGWTERHRWNCWHHLKLNWRIARSHIWSYCFKRRRSFWIYKLSSIKNENNIPLKQSMSKSLAAPQHSSISNIIFHFENKPKLGLAALRHSAISIFISSLEINLS